jgi:hypothetical protein
MFNVDKHSVAVLITGKELDMTTGFTTVANAVMFIEEQLPEDFNSLGAIAEAFEEDGIEIGEFSYRIMDGQIYFEMNEDDDDSEQ